MTHRRGNFAIIVALVFTVLLTFAALAIDVSYIRMARLQAQNAADAGAHAGMVALRDSGDEDEARDIATAVAAQNLVAGKSVTLEDDNIVFGEWDFYEREFSEGGTINAISVDVDRSSSTTDGAVNLMIAPLIGWDVASVSANSVGALRYRDTMLVLDITRSFKDEIEDAVEAVQTFLDITYNDGHPGDRLGLVTFVGAAETYTPIQNVATNYSTLSSDWDELDYCWDPVWDMNDNTNMQHCCDPAVCPSPWTNWEQAGTNQGAGLAEAIDQLDEESDIYALKTIVIVSDGQPTCWNTSILPDCDIARAAYGQSMADVAEDNEMSIFSVSFNDPYDPVQSAYMESLIRGYGEFYETPDQEDLPLILEAIAESIPVAIVL
ncbi:MAG: TadE/TadG family protein [Proteobacteria bacterium]|nr:TadE/TadG family protein [Pseudomonadota bacterium]MCP4918918.1 TadE/TadG family protein [Pseudomonadota bacterium]